SAILFQSKKRVFCSKPVSTFFHSLFCPTPAWRHVNKLPLSDFQKTKLGQNWALVSVISRGLCELYAKTRSETILYPAYKDSLCPTITCHVQPNYTTMKLVVA